MYFFDKRVAGRCFLVHLSSPRSQGSIDLRERRCGWFSSRGTTENRTHWRSEATCRPSPQSASGRATIPNRVRHSMRTSRGSPNWSRKAIHEYSFGYRHTVSPTLGSAPGRSCRILRTMLPSPRPDTPLPAPVPKALFHLVVATPEDERSVVSQAFDVMDHSLLTFAEEGHCRKG